MSNYKRSKLVFRDPVVVSVSLIRVLSALSILVEPLLGFLLYWYVDYFDSYFLIQKTKLTREQYHLVDKYLDWFGYLAMFYLGLQGFLATYLSALLLLRLVGQVVYLKSRNTKYFLMFPNLFEMTFLWFVLLDRWGVRSLPVENKHLYLLAFLYLIQFGREIWLHFIWHRVINRKGYPKWIESMGYGRLVKYKDR